VSGITDLNEITATAKARHIQMMQKAGAVTNVFSGALPDFMAAQTEHAQTAQRLEEIIGMANFQTKKNPNDWYALAGARIDYEKTVLFLLLP